MMAFLSVDALVLLKVAYSVVSKEIVWVVKLVAVMVDWKAVWKVAMLVVSKD